MRIRATSHRCLGALVALLMLFGGFSLEAAPRKSKKVSVSPLVDLDGILDKEKKKKKEKARPRSMGELLDSRQLVALVDVKLDEEISLAKQLISFDTTCEGASPVRFRLGDLYWEKSKRAFFESQDLDLKKRDRQAAQKRMGDYQKQTLKWYRDILDLCPQYEATPKVLYYLGRVYVELGKPKTGARYFKRIIQEHIDSEWSGKSWFMIGEYYFDTAQDIEKSLQAYERASADLNQSVAGFSLYKEGWCYINTGDWEVALRRFGSVVRWLSEKKILSEGPADGLRREALKDYVRAYSNIQPEYSVKGLGKPEDAFARFSKVADIDLVPKLVEDLGLLYRGRDSHRNVILIYQDLAKRFPESKRRIVWQSYVLEAVSRAGTRTQIIANLEQLSSMLLDALAKDAASPLVDKKNKAVLRESYNVAERIVRNLGLERHKEGRRLRGKARNRSFRFAADVYDAYLKVFTKGQLGGEVDYPYYVQFYQAELFLQLGLLDKAAGAFEKVAQKGESKKSDREKKMALRAAEESVHAFERVWQEQLATKTPKEIITRTEDAFAQSAARYLGLMGKKKDPQSVGIRYKLGKIAYDRGRLTEALDQFEVLVQRHAKNKVACYAANLILDIHNGEKDFTKLEERARVFARMKSLSCSSKERAQLLEIAQQAAFGLVKESAGEKADGEALAKAYLDYFRRYRSSSLGDKALYQAALAYQTAGNEKSATQVKLKLIKTFPKSELARETLFTMAAEYENAVDLKKARKLFELFAERYAEDKRAPVAWLKVAKFSTAMGDVSRAQKSYGKVGSSYASHPQAHLAALKSCEPLEKEIEEYRRDGFKPSKKRAELLDKCYASWLSEKLYRSRDADLRCYVLTRRAQLYRGALNSSARAKGYQKDADVVWQSIADNITSERRRCSDARAEIGFREFESAYQNFAKLSLSPLDPSSPKAIALFQASLSVVTERRDGLLKKYREITALGSETWSVAAAYRAGAVLQQSVEKLLRAPIAATLQLSEEDEAMVRDGLREKAAPLRQLALSHFRDCLEVSRALAVGGIWVDKARNALAKMSPLNYGATQERWQRSEGTHHTLGILRLFRRQASGAFEALDVAQVKGLGTESISKGATP